MVGKGEADEDLEAEITEECSKHGKVVKCTVRELPQAAEDEAVRIFVHFAEVASAVKGALAVAIAATSTVAAAAERNLDDGRRRRFLSVRLRSVQRAERPLLWRARSVRFVLGRGHVSERRFAVNVVVHAR
jgi:hypothetical protein